MNRLAILALLIVAPITLTACDKAAPSTSSTNTPTVSETEPIGWLLTSPPSNPVSIADIKPNAVEGDAVVLTARIGGRKAPITPGVGVLVIVDHSLQSCDQIPGDNCPAPWDYCCEPRENLIAHTATVQIVDSQGKPVKTDLAASGFRPLDTIIITGIVAARPSPEVLTIHATGIHRVQN